MHGILHEVLARVTAPGRPEELDFVRRMDLTTPREYALSTVEEEIMRHWEGMICDTSEDEFSAGGQSLRELERIERLEEYLFTLPQIEIPTFHFFADGVYLREIHAPAGAIIIGHRHQNECFNIMRAGRVLTITNGEVSEFVPPFMGKSGAITRKASFVIEDMIWTTVHPNPDNEQRIEVLESRFLIKSPVFLSSHEQR